KYRIRWDEADESGHTDPWMMTIPCRLGIIYPHGGDVLAVEVDGHPVIAKRLAAIDGVKLWQDGEDEETFLFHVDLFNLVAAVVLPKRKSQLTDEQRQKRADGMAAVRACKKASPAA